MWSQGVVAAERFQGTFLRAIWWALGCFEQASGGPLGSLRVLAAPSSPGSLQEVSQEPRDPRMGFQAPGVVLPGRNGALAKRARSF